MSEKTIVRSTPAPWMRIAWPLAALFGVLLIVYGTRALFSDPVPVTIRCERAANACTWTAGSAKPETVALEPGSRFEVYRVHESKHSTYCPVVRRANGHVTDVGPRCITAQVSQLHVAMDRLEAGLESGAEKWEAGYVSSYALIDVVDVFAFGGILVMLAFIFAAFGASSWASIDPITRTITIEYGLARKKKTQEVRFEDVVSVVPRADNVELHLTAGRVVPLAPSGRLRDARTQAEAVAKLLDKPLRSGSV